MKNFITLNMSACYAVGSSGMDVSTIQLALSVSGYAPGPIDGKFGSNTKTAVMKFQHDHGLKTDGIVGQHTLAAMPALCGKVTKVYVFREPLLGIGVKIGTVAHSGLKLETTDGHSYRAEICADGRAHLSDWYANPHTTIQEQGASVPHSTDSPAKWVAEMDDVAQRRGAFHLTENNCHMAQEEIRAMHGLEVKDRYVPLSVKITCHDCRGAGKHTSEFRLPCSACMDSISQRLAGKGLFMCGICHGTKFILIKNETMCLTCLGSGLTLR